MAAAAAIGGRARGAFILLEGVDRCGKSTQATRLVEHLTASGVPAELWNFPDRTTAIGQLINAYLASSAELDDGTVHLLFSANRWEKRQRLIDTLSAGTTLVVDRYAFSGAAFTAAKGVPALDLPWCKAPDRGLPAPDVVLYLSLPLDVAEKRGGFGQERYERREMQQQVQIQFEALRDDTWRIVDAGQSPDDVAAEIAAAVAPALDAAAAGQPLQTMW